LFSDFPTRDVIWMLNESRETSKDKLRSKRSITVYTWVKVNFNLIRQLSEMIIQFSRHLNKTMVIVAYRKTWQSFSCKKLQIQVFCMQKT
jgi:hypothetical protein